MKTTILDRSSLKKVDSRYTFLLQHYKPGKILDVGNIGGLHGEGNTGSHKRFVNEVTDSEVFGIDMCLPKNPGGYTNQKQGNVEEGLPYPDCMFDTVYMGEIIEHLTNFKTALQEIKRVLKPDGVFIVDTPNAYDIKRLLRYFIKRNENMGDPTHTVFFTPASLIATLKREGFIVTEIATKGFFETHLMVTSTPQ